MHMRQHLLHCPGHVSTTDGAETVGETARSQATRLRRETHHIGVGVARSGRHSRSISNNRFTATKTTLAQRSHATFRSSRNRSLQHDLLFVYSYRNKSKSRLLAENLEHYGSGESVGCSVRDHVCGIGGHVSRRPQVPPADSFTDEKLHARKRHQVRHHNYCLECDFLYL